MISNTQFKALAKKYGTPLYIYDASLVERQFNALRYAISYEPKRIHFAVKANSNLYILKLLRNLGAGFDVGSPTEFYLAKKVGSKNADISVTGRNFSTEELRYLLKNNAVINADSLSQLEAIGKFFSPTGSTSGKVALRINPASGAGHHKKVITAGRNSTFGIYYRDAGKAKKIAKKYNQIGR